MMIFAPSHLQMPAQLNLFRSLSGELPESPEDFFKNSLVDVFFNKTNGLYASLRTRTGRLVESTDEAASSRLLPSIDKFVAPSRAHVIIWRQNFITCQPSDFLFQSLRNHGFQCRKAISSASSGRANANNFAPSSYKVN